MQFIISFLFCFLTGCATLFCQNSLPLFDYSSTNISQQEIIKGEEMRDIVAAPLQVNLTIDPLSLPESFSTEIKLLRGINYSVDMERIARRHPVGDADIYYGTTNDPNWAHLPHYRDVIMVVNRNSAKIVLHVMSSDGIFSALPRANGLYEISEEKAPDCTVGRDGSKSLSLDGDALEQSFMMTLSCDEQDQNGDYVVDLFFGYSHQAESSIGDLLAYSIAQVETVNVGFTNSLVPDMYLRLVDYGVKDFNVGVFGSSINAFWNEFSDDVTAAGADFGAFYDTAYPGANNGGGYSFVPGRASINGAGSTGVFRHEWGHGSGSRHCPTDGGGTAAYASGWNNGNGTTHMCGNGTNFFSNPNINDAMGTAIGDVTTADNTRNITERRTIYANYAQHATPYDALDGTQACDPQILADGRYTIRNVNSMNYLSTIGSGYTGDEIDQATPAATENWEIRHFKNNNYFIMNFSSGRTLNVFGSSSSPGNNVGVWTSGTSNNQRWLIEAVGNGNFRLKAFNNLCLQIPNGDTADGDLVIQDVCDATNDEEWIIEAVTPAGDPIVAIGMTATDASCSTSTDGTVTAAASGGTGIYTYAWSNNGETTATISAVSAGEYVVTVVSGGRNYFATDFVKGAAPLIPESTITHATPTQTGTINITNVQNAATPITYTWSDGGTGAMRTALAGGDYTVTISDANGCTDIRPFRIFSTLDDGAEYVIQHVASGLYVHPINGTTSTEQPTVLGICPTDDAGYRWRADISFGDLVRFRNQKAGRYMSARNQQEVGRSFDLTGWNTVNQNNFLLTKVGADTYTMANNAAGNYTSVSGMAIGDSLIQTTPVTGAHDVFRLIPVVACSPDAIATVCDDTDNTTDNDQINLICDCCGEPNECYGIGDADGDRNCTDTDCEDTDAAIFIGSPCDDTDASTVGDALTTDCNCVGRPTTCTETGTDLDNVAEVGTGDVRNSLSGSAPASVLNDGNTNGTWSAGEVWHSGAGYSWAEMALLQEELIKEIIIYPRTDCCFYRLDDVWVLVSENPFTSDGLTDMQAESVFQHQIPANNTTAAPVSIPVGVMGRYVRLKADNSYLNLAEIEVRTCPQAILPVSLVEFAGEVQVKSNHLYWTTETETNNAGFAIERSFDGRAFEKIGYVKGAGSSDFSQNYTFDDTEMPISKVFYRLRQIDFDGTEAFSSVISLTRENEEKNWQIYPNPISQNSKLFVNLKEGTEVSFELFGLDGRMVKQYATGQISLSLQGLPTGVYLLRNQVDGEVSRVVIY